MTIFYNTTSTLTYQDYKTMETKIQEENTQNQSKLPLYRDLESNIISRPVSEHNNGALIIPLKKANNTEEQDSLSDSVSYYDIRQGPTFPTVEEIDKMMKDNNAKTPMTSVRKFHRHIESPMVRGDFHSDVHSNRCVPRIEEKSLFALHPVIESEVSEGSAEEDPNKLFPLPPLYTKKYNSECKPS